MPGGCVSLNGVDIVFEKLEETGSDEELAKNKKLHKRVKKGLDDYIKERYHAMLYDVSLDSTNETAELLRTF